MDPAWGDFEAGEELSPALLAALNLSESPQAPAPATGPADAPAAAEDAGSASADEMTCSICLQHTELEEIAGVKGCDHTYCVKCILRWAAHRDTPTCPQCKAPFDSLLTYYRLDGTLNDFPCEESVCLLKRARFFTDHMQMVEQGRWKLSAYDGGSEWRDYEPYFQEYDDDEAVEDYYFSAAAGRARVVLGNRRFGENGFVSSGRAYARPARTPNAQHKKGGGGKAASPAPPKTPLPPSGRSRRNKGKSAASPAVGPSLVAGANSGAFSSTAAPPPPVAAPCSSQPIAMAGGGRAAQAAAAAAQADGGGGASSAAAFSPHSPFGCSPGGSSGGGGGGGAPGTGRRAKRNNRRQFEDCMAALPGAAAC